MCFFTGRIIPHRHTVAGITPSHDQLLGPQGNLLQRLSKAEEFTFAAPQRSSLLDSPP